MILSGLFLFFCCCFFVLRIQVYFTQHLSLPRLNPMWEHILYCILHNYIFHTWFTFNTTLSCQQINVTLSLRISRYSKKPLAYKTRNIISYCLNPSTFSHIPETILFRKSGLIFPQYPVVSLL